MLNPHIHPSRLQEAIPEAIERLVHPDPTIRMNSARCLERWTGQLFYRKFAVSAQVPPSPNDAAKMQALWAEWWAAARETFQPYTQ